MKKQLILPSAILVFLITATSAFVFYGRGYRLLLNGGKPIVSGTGLLVATSLPDGAEVFINNHLTTATNNTINLSPGEYTVGISKQGYFPWEKKLKIQKEVVAKAEALLFPTTPKLESITAIGVEHPTLDPSSTRIAYTVASQTTRKNGVYVLDMTTRPILTLQSGSTHIADDTLDAFSKTTLAWSPDGQEILASTSGTLGSPTTYLLRANTLNESPRDVTATLLAIESLWQQQRLEKEEARLQSLRPPIRRLLTENFNVISWSPDETKVLYQASTSATLPLIITPRLIGFDTTPEDRALKKGQFYVYDTKEDKNYKIGTETAGRQELTWFPDSKHLISVRDGKIEILEYDGTNRTTIYAGPFVDNYVFPSPNGSKIIVLTNLGNSSIPPNLYTISLK